jgi:HPt (histidine-containing phosphotransfer) domain-containing protein
MKFVRWTLTSLARRFSNAGLGLTISAASSPASRPLDGSPVREPAETVAIAGPKGDVPAGFARAQEDTAIHSRYANNIRFSPIVRKFSARLHEQLERADAAQSSGDMEALARFGHWLAGTAGTVGYDAFTPPARELQALATRGDAQAAATALKRLARMASRLVVPDAVASS